MTCAHVVAVALGRDEVARCEVGESVIVDLPSAGRLGVRASIAAYFPMVRSDRLIDDPVADVAVLRLEGSGVAGGVTPGRVNRRLVPGQHFTTFGFPAGFDQGTPASGEVVVQDFWDWVQVVDNGTSGHFLTPGFSGAPAFAAGGTELIGMVCQSEKDERLRLGALIPADTLCKAWPPLAQPYQRLESFTEHEADMFFGRESFVAELKDKLGRSPVAMVVGPSGSGKSSVVLAGLVPKLRQDEWIVVQCRPLEAPLNELASGFASARIGSNDHNRPARLDLADKWVGWLREDPRRIFEIAREMNVGARRQKPVLLVIDQFEELFTNDAAAHDGAVRRKDEVTPDHGSPRQKAFLEVLEAIAGQDPGSRLPIRAVATLRADYMDAALRIGALARLMKDADVKLGPMRTPELTAAIEKPAKYFRVEFDGGLVPDIVSEMKGRPGGLPLLQFALDRLWRRQEDRRLTFKGYQGKDGESGIATAINEHAETVRREIDDDDALRRVMLQLVRVAEGLPDARAVVGRSMFSDKDWSQIEKLAKERLVMISTAADGGQTAEVVHEALIGSWTRLTTWLEEDREFRLWHQRLGQALQEYRLDRDGGVLTGRRLAEAEDWLKTHKSRLSTVEMAFIENCKKLGVSDRKRESRTRRTIYAGILALGLISVAAAFFAIISSRERTNSQEISRLNLVISTEQAISRADELLWSGFVDEALLLLLDTSAQIASQKIENFDEALVERLTIAMSRTSARATREQRFPLPLDTRAISSASGLYLHDTNLGTLSIVTEEGPKPLGRVEGRIMWVGTYPGLAGTMLLAIHGRDIKIFRIINTNGMKEIYMGLIPSSLPDGALPTISIDSSGTLDLHDWWENDGETDVKYFDDGVKTEIDLKSVTSDATPSPPEPSKASENTQRQFEERLRISGVWQIIEDWRRRRDSEPPVDESEAHDLGYVKDPETLLATCLKPHIENENFDTLARAILDATKPENGSWLNGGTLASCQVAPNRVLINSFYGGSAGMFVHTELYQVESAEIVSLDDGMNLSSVPSIFVQRVFNESYNVSEVDAIDDPVSINLPMMRMVQSANEEDGMEAVIMWSGGGRTLNFWKNPWDSEQIMYNRDVEESAFIGDGSSVALVTSLLGAVSGPTARELVVVAVNGPVRGKTVLLGGHPATDSEGGGIEAHGLNELLSIDNSITGLASTFPRYIGDGFLLNLIENGSHGLAIALIDSKGEVVGSLRLPASNDVAQSESIVSWNLKWSLTYSGHLVKVFDAHGELIKEIQNPTNVLGARFLGSGPDFIVADGSFSTTVWRRLGSNSWQSAMGPSVQDGNIWSALPDSSGRYVILTVDTGAQDLSVRLYHVDSGDEWGELVNGYKWATGDFSPLGVAYGDYSGITEFSIPSLSEVIDRASALVSEHCRPQDGPANWRSSSCWESFAEP